MNAYKEPISLFKYRKLPENLHNPQNQKKKKSSDNRYYQ